MKTLRKYFLIPLVGIISTASLVAANNDHDTIVDEILGKYLNFIGGKDAVANIESRIAIGESVIEAMNLSLPLRMIQQMPDKIFVEQEIPGLGKAVQGFDGTIGWSEDPMTGFRKMTEGELTTFKRMSRLDRELDLRALYAEIHFLRRESGDEGEIIVLQFVPEQGEKEEWFFLEDTGKLLKVSATLDLGPQGRLPAVTKLLDYRDVDGLMVPFKMEVSNPAFRVLTRLHSIEHNIEVDPTIFSPPVN